MPREQDELFARAVLRLRLADEEVVEECMKTVVDGEAPNLPEAMVRLGALNREQANRALQATSADGKPPDARLRQATEQPPAIDGYEVLSKLGEGGMGTVWKARQLSLNRLVAIKLLPLEFCRDTKLINRFRREAMATARLNHPNIVSAIDVGVIRREGAPEQHYFVMEYVDGESLQEIIARAGKIEPRRAAEVAANVASALDHAWSHAGIIHRDIKPGNVLIGRNDAVKLTDLGLARSTWERCSLTTTGLAIGTPHYVSPEQAQGKASVDVRSDIYSLGATMFHMLTGRTVFPDGPPAAVMARHVNEDAPSCSEVDRAVPATLSAVVAKMMKRDPEQRYLAPGEVVADLQRFLRGERPLAYTRMLAASEATGVRSRPPEVYRTPAREEPQKSRRPGRVLPAVLAAAVLAAGLWYAARNNYLWPSAPSGSAGPSLWFELSHPEGVVGQGGSFPLEFNSASGVRFHVRREGSGFVYLVMFTCDASTGDVRPELLWPDEAARDPAAAPAQLPGDGLFHPLPASSGSAVFIAAAASEPMGREELLGALDGISGELSASRFTVPHRRTLWYGHDGRNWTAGGGGAASGATEGLDELVAKLSAVFGRRQVALCGAAVSWR